MVKKKFIQTLCVLQLFYVLEQEIFRNIYLEPHFKSSLHVRKVLLPLIHLANRSRQNQGPSRIE